MGRKNASDDLTFEEKQNFHANFRYMWDKLGTSYYYILGPDSKDDFEERRNGINDDLGLLPSYTICSKCYTGKENFWPGRNTIRKVVNFYNRWITPEISVAEIISTRLAESDDRRFRIGDEMDHRFIGVYYGYYWSQNLKKLTGAYLILTPGSTKMMAHLITGFRTDEDLHEQNLLDHVIGTNKISNSSYHEWFIHMPVQKQQTNYYTGEAEMNGSTIVIRLSGNDRDFRRMTLILNTRAFAQSEKFNRSSDGFMAFVLSSGTGAAPPFFCRMGFIRKDSFPLSLETQQLGELLINDRSEQVTELTTGLDSKWIETVWALKADKNNPPRI